MASQWESLHYKVKALEARLEKKVLSYSAMAQKANSNFLRDEENPLIDANDEHALASEIEHDLAELNDSIQTMKQFNGSALSNNQEQLIKRYHEIHFDYSSEFRRISAALQSKRESMELFQTSSQRSDGQNSATNSLLREKFGIQQSMNSVGELIQQAFETKNALTNQRNTLTGSGNTLSNITSTVPGVNRLIEGITRKRSRESTVIAVVIGVLICFTIWWVFLR